MTTALTPTDTPHGFVARSEDAEQATWPFSGDTFALLADSTRTSGSFSLTEHRGVAGATVPPHVYDDTDEAFYVLDGEYRFTISDEEYIAGNGCFVFIPRGAWH